MRNDRSVLARASDQVQNPMTIEHERVHEHKQEKREEFGANLRMDASQKGKVERTERAKHRRNQLLRRQGGESYRCSRVPFSASIGYALARLSSIGIVGLHRTDGNRKEFEGGTRGLG